MVARYSEPARGAKTVSKERLVRRADAMAGAVRRLAELVVIEPEAVVDRDTLIEEAQKFVDEVEEEDDGLCCTQPTQSAVCSEARLICAEDGSRCHPPSSSARERQPSRLWLRKRRDYAGPRFSLGRDWAG